MRLMIGAVSGPSGASDALGRQVGDRRRVAAPVVVEDDDHPLAGVTEVVQRLVGHPARHRPVADHGDDVTMIGDAEVAGDGQPVGVAEDRRGMRVLDEVVRALGPRRVAAETTGLAEPGEVGLTAGDELVHVRLMAGVPEQGVVG